MTRHRISSLGSAPLFAGFLALVLAGVHRPAAARKEPPVPLAGFGSLPLAFEPNVGQAGPAGAIRFLAHGRGYELFLAPTEAVLAVGAGPDGAVHLRLVDANPQATGSGEQALPGKVNYLRGSDAKAWRRNVPTFGQVRVREVYPGVDLLYYGRAGHLEHDFVVAPGADPDRIRMEFQGAQSVRLQEEGSLSLTTSGGEVTQRPPLAYQEIDGRRVKVPARFRVQALGVRPWASGSDARPVETASDTEGLPLRPKVQGLTPPTVGFELAAYDRTKPLIIDPIIVWSTYLGAHSYFVPPPRKAGVEAVTGYTEVDAITTDTEGSVYVAGITTSLKFPIRNAVQTEFAGVYDAFVTKYAADGQSILYSTYLGGSSWERTGDIAVNALGEAYVVGQTESADFPTANALQPNLRGSADGFITRLTADGSAFVYSTYLGGSFLSDSISSIALTAAGEPWIAGITPADDFPIVNPLQPVRGGAGDVFVARLTADGASLAYSTFLGGPNSERSPDLALDSSGNVVIVGLTWSLGFPTVNAIQPQGRYDQQDAFVAKMTADGSAMVFATYLGGSGWEHTAEVAVDREGSIFVAGTTESRDDFPLTRPWPKNTWGWNGFLTKLPPDGSRLEHSQSFGGATSDEVRGVAVDELGRVYVTGWTSDPAGPYRQNPFPVKDPLQPGYAGGLYDAFLTQFEGDTGGLLFSSMIGGSYDDQSNAVTVAPDGSVCIGGTTNSPDFPVKNALDPKRSGNASFVMKLSFDPPPATGQLAVSATDLDFGDGAPNAPRTLELVLKNIGRGALRVSPSRLAAPFAVEPSGPLTLQPGQLVTLKVTFTPGGSGRFTGTLRLGADKGQPKSVKIALRGRAQVASSP
jgi:hypothetical protein